MGLILFLAGCGHTKKETKYYDGDFITAMEQGLEDRWKLNDKGDEDDPTKA